MYFFKKIIQDERDEYDDEFEKIREANRKTRSVQVKDEYESSVKLVDKCRKDLAYAKGQVDYTLILNYTLILFYTFFKLKILSSFYS